MKNKKDEKWLDKIISRAVDFGKTEFDAQKWNDKFLSNESYGASRSNIRIKSHKNFWRFIMENKVTKYSAAAVVTLALTLVLFSPFGTPKNGDIVWAKVAQNVKEIPTVVHREKRLFYEQDQNEPFLIADVMKYVSLDDGIVEEQYNAEGNLMYRAYILKKSQRVLMIFPPHKRYLELPLDETFASKIDSVTPKGLVDYFTSRTSTELGRSCFDGIEVEGFAINDVSIFPIPEQYRFLLPLEDLHYRLWVDVKSLLPVGAEAELTSGRGLLTWFKRLRVMVRAYDFQWNAELPHGIFDPNVPDDYTELKATDFLPAEAKAGFVGLGIIPIAFILWRRNRKKS
jgi:hypothetical protein